MNNRYDTRRVGREHDRYEADRGNARSDRERYERDRARDVREDVDPPWWPAEHPERSLLGELGRRRRERPEPEVNERVAEPAAVRRRGLDPHVEVLREPRLAVNRHGVPADHQEPDAAS